MILVGVGREWGGGGRGGHNSTHKGSVSLVEPRLILECLLFLCKEFGQQLFFSPEESEGCEVVGLCSSRDLLRRRWSLGLALGRKNVLLTFH